MAQSKHKCVSTHQEDIATGQTVWPGDVVALDPDDAHNKRLIDDSKFVAVPSTKKESK